MTIGCLTCKQKFARFRGCCSQCYKRHLDAVKTGTTTWAEVESKGLCNPPKKGMRGKFLR